jgi:hypothetical protein
LALLNIRGCPKVTRMTYIGKVQGHVFSARAELDMINPTSGPYVMLILIPYPLSHRAQYVPGGNRGMSQPGPPHISIFVFSMINYIECPGMERPLLFSARVGSGRLNLRYRFDISCRLICILFPVNLEQNRIFIDEDNSLLAGIFLKSRMEKADGS